MFSLWPPPSYKQLTWLFILLIQTVNTNNLHCDTVIHSSHKVVISERVFFSNIKDRTLNTFVLQGKDGVRRDTKDDRMTLYPEPREVLLWVGHSSGTLIAPKFAHYLVSKVFKGMLVVINNNVSSECLSASWRFNLVINLDIWVIILI